VGIEAEGDASPMLLSTFVAIWNGRGPPRVVISSSERSVNSAQYCYHTQRDIATFLSFVILCYKLVEGARIVEPNLYDMLGVNPFADSDSSSSDTILTNSR
jgi:hypothetical protein